MVKLCKLHPEIQQVDTLGKKMEKLEKTHEHLPSNDYAEISYEYKAKQERFYFECRETIQSFVPKFLKNKNAKNR